MAPLGSIRSASGTCCILRSIHSPRAGSNEGHHFFACLAARPFASSALRLARVACGDPQPACARAWAPRRGQPATARGLRAPGVANVCAYTLPTPAQHRGTNRLRKQHGSRRLHLGCVVHFLSRACVLFAADAAGLPLVGDRLVVRREAVQRSREPRHFHVPHRVCNRRRHSAAGG